MKSIAYLFCFCLLFLTGCIETKTIEQKDIVELTEVLLEEIPQYSSPIVFIAGFDQGTNTYYGNASKYFREKQFEVVNHIYTLEEMIHWLNTNKKGQSLGEIHIVSHSNPWKGMALRTSKNGARITYESLVSSRVSNAIPSLKTRIESETKIIFHSCGLGDNIRLLEELKAVFTNHKAPKVYASSYFNVFGGKYASHYLAKPYYGFYPTAESPGPFELSKTFEAAYPNEKIDWFRALKTREEHHLGSLYTYKFNVPVQWEFSFNAKAEIPKFANKEGLLDWIASNDEMATTLFQFGIPLEKYRWKSKVNGTKLTVEGKTTVLCVLKPILSSLDTNEYHETNIEAKKLYQIL